MDRNRYFFTRFKTDQKSSEKVSLLGRPVVPKHSSVGEDSSMRDKGSIRPQLCRMRTKERNQGLMLPVVSEDLSNVFKGEQSKRK